MKKIFVVEDDGSICDELVQILENEGYEAESLKNFDNTKDGHRDADDRPNKHYDRNSSPGSFSIDIHSNLHFS